MFSPGRRRCASERRPAAPDKAATDTPGNRNNANDLSGAFRAAPRHPGSQADTRRPVAHDSPVAATPQQKPYPERPIFKRP